MKQTENAAIQPTTTVDSKPNGKKQRETVMVFGATGTVGAYAEIELTKNYNVIAVGRRKSDHGSFADYGIQYFSVDIASKDDFVKLPRSGVSAVVHTAGNN